MKIAATEVERVALLARLRLTSEETEELTRDLNAIVEYVDKLNEVDTSTIEPFVYPQAGVPVLREDAVTNRPDREALLATAPDRDGPFFKVPKIIE